MRTTTSYGSPSLSGMTAPAPCFRRRDGLACKVPEFAMGASPSRDGRLPAPAPERNWSLLDDKDRDASWKRLLRADTRVPDREARRDVVRRVLAQIDPKDVVGSLGTVVAAGVQGVDTTPVPGFRSRLVAEPRLIEYCERRMLRFEEDSAFLLAQTQRNGHHVRPLCL